VYHGALAGLYVAATAGWLWTSALAARLLAELTGMDGVATMRSSE
jgi:hypothetical protein